MKVVNQSFEILEDSDDLVNDVESRGRICYKSEGAINEESAWPFVQKIIKNGHGTVLEMGRIGFKYPVNSIMARAYYTVLRDLKFIEKSIDTNFYYFSGSIRAWREAWNYIPSTFKRALYNISPLFDIPNKVCPSDLELKRYVPTSEELVYVYHKYQAVKIITNRAITHEIVRHRPCSFLQESQRYCRYDKEQFGGEVTFIKPMFFKEGSPEYTLWAQAMAETESLYLRLLETSSPQAARTVLPNSCKTEIIVYASLREWQHIFALRTSLAAEPSMREIMIPLHEEFKKMYPVIFDNPTIIKAGF